MNTAVAAEVHEGTRAPDEPPPRRSKGPASSRPLEIIRNTNKPFQLYIDSPEGSTVPLNGSVIAERARSAYRRLSKLRGRH